MPILRTRTPSRRTRAKPGRTGRGQYYRVELLPRSEFVTFRTQDVGRAGHIQRLAGRRSTGSWSTASWLISKQDAHVRSGRLVADTRAAKQILAALGSAPTRVSGDRFRAQAKSSARTPRRKNPRARRTRRVAR